MPCKLTLILLALTSLPLAAQTPSSLTGRYLVSVDYLGTPRFYQLDLTQTGETLSGQYQGNKLEGTLHGSALHFIAKDEDGNTADITGTVKAGIINATEVDTDASNPTHSTTYPITATIPAALTRPATQRHEFTPTVYYRSFSPLNKPVLTLNPGDTLHTTTVDAGGTDFQNIRRSAGGNPQTGPFYIQGAMPGDTLVVHIVHLKLNRDYAISDDNMDDRALNSNLAVRMKDNNHDIRWHLDLEKGLASPEKPGEHMKSFTIPVRPMLGCVATATSPGQSPPPTQDSGNYGGNMDFNGLVEGSTLYLPISNPGALLYFGDGHALQGDGELNGNALETSLDVEIVVDVIQHKRIGGRRIETPTHIIAMGLDGSIDDAFKSATENMSNWLEQDYKLTPSEIAQFLGVAAEYHVSEVADRNAGIVLLIAKSKLARLTTAK